jgi:dihydrofolate reductase
MRKVILQTNVTLDGFTADTNESFDWCIYDQQGRDELFENFYRQFDTILLGRFMYGLLRPHWSVAYENMNLPEGDRAFSRWINQTPKVIFSHTLARVDWQNARVAQDAVSEVRRLKEQPGKDILILNCTRLSRSLMSYGLIDEYWLILHPVAIGAGRTLFGGLNERLYLKLFAYEQYTAGPLFLRYARVSSKEEQ